MDTVVTDVSGHLKVSLSEIDNAVISVPPVDKIINDAVLVVLTNQIIKDGKVLVVRRQLFERDNFIPTVFK